MPCSIGGASLVLYADLPPATRRLASSPSVASLAATLVWVCNYPHFASTNYRLYHSRSSMAQYPLTSFVTPLVMVAAVIGCYLSPNDIAPLFIKLYLLWSPYHFSGQTLGHHHGVRPSLGVRDRRLAPPQPHRVHLLDVRRAERVGRGRPARQPVLRRPVPHSRRPGVASADPDQGACGWRWPQRSPC